MTHSPHLFLLRRPRSSRDRIVDDWVCGNNCSGNCATNLSRCWHYLKCSRRCSGLGSCSIGRNDASSHRGHHSSRNWGGRARRGSTDLWRCRGNSVQGCCRLNILTVRNYELRIFAWLEFYNPSLYAPLAPGLEALVLIFSEAIASKLIEPNGKGIFIDGNNFTGRDWVTDFDHNPFILRSHDNRLDLSVLQLPYAFDLEFIQRIGL